MRSLPLSGHSFTRTTVIMKTMLSLEFFYQLGQTLHRYRGAILFWIYMLAIMAYAYRWVEY